MIKNCILFSIAFFLSLGGCRSAIETVEKEEPALKIRVGITKEEVLRILSSPDFTASSDGEAIFFYCPNLNNYDSQSNCTPIFFEENRVVEIGTADFQKWPLWRVRFAVEKSGQIREKRMTEKTAVDDIAEETLFAQDAYTPKEGDRVYINYYRAFARSVPLRSIPSRDGKILRPICKGTELIVLTVQDSWLFVEGAIEVFTGWVHKLWVTGDQSVKIDSEKRRKKLALEIARLESIVKPIPRSNWKENLRIYKQLLDLDPCNEYYQRKVNLYEKYGRRVKKSRRK